MGKSGHCFRCAPTTLIAMTRIVLMDDYLDFARTLPSVQALERRAKLQIYTHKAQSDLELHERLTDADIVISVRDRVRFDASALQAAPRLKLISVCGPRLDHIDLLSAHQAGIQIWAAPKSDSAWSVHYATAEATWGIILAMMKDLCLNERVMRDGGWQTGLSRDLYGRTLGIIGLGKIGAQVARIGRCMGMRVLAWGPSLTKEKAAERGAQYESMQTLLETSDVVSIHANLTPHSKSLIDRAQLQAMKPSAILINTARAGLVSESALREALDHGWIAGAGVDVYWEEPLPAGHWLRVHPKAFLQPHIGGFSEDGYRDLLEPAVQYVLAYLAGEVPAT